MKNTMYLCTRFSGARQFENGALIALAGKIIATDTRRVEMSIGRLGAGPPYDKGKGQITIGASPKLPSARSLFSNHSNPQRNEQQHHRKIQHGSGRNSTEKKLAEERGKALSGKSRTESAIKENPSLRTTQRPLGTENTPTDRGKHNVTRL